jgi:hypothetical protein
VRSHARLPSYRAINTTRAVGVHGHLFCNTSRCFEAQSPAFQVTLEPAPILE